MSENFDRCIVDKIMNDTEILMQCLMDSSDGLVTNILGNHSDIRADIEEISRNLIYDIHIFRAVNISDYEKFLKKLLKTA
jgi:thiamine monophosphate kinase